MREKPQLGFWRIANMCFGFFGIQFGFALQNANASRIFQSLGAAVDDLPILWLAAPVTGLLVQPIIGYMSDRTWGRLGRRRPYFLFGAILATLALFVMPNSPWLWVAAGTLWILDASINITMEPFRALVGDMLPNRQRSFGFALQSLFIGTGAVIASALPWMLANWAGVSNVAPDGGIPDTVHWAFYAGAAVFLAAVLVVLRIGGARAGFDQHQSGVGFVDAHPPCGDHPDRLREQRVLGRVDRRLELLPVAAGRHRHRALEHDRPRIDPLIDEMNSDPGDPHAVLERPPDRVEARKRRQQRRMHVDDPVRKAPHEPLGEQLHVPGEDDQVHVTSGEPVGDRPVALLAVGEVADREGGGLDPGAARALDRLRRGLVGADGDHLDPLAPVELVEDRLQIGAGPRRQHPDPECAAHAATFSFGNLPPVDRSRPASIRASTSASRTSARQAWKSP